MPSRQDRPRLGVECLGDRVMPSVVVAGSDSGGLVRVFDATTTARIGDLKPLGDVRGGVRVGSGDFNGDGAADIVAAAGPGDLPLVSVIDGVTYRTLAVFHAFDAKYVGGSHVAAGDFDGDGHDDLAVGTGRGATLIRVFDGASFAFGVARLSGEFHPFGLAPIGVTLAAGDLDGDGRDSVIAAPESGPTHVRSFDLAIPDETVGPAWFGFAPIGEGFFAFDPAFRGGVSLAAGDSDADGRDEIIAGAGPSGVPEVRVFDASGRMRSSFMAYASAFRGGVRVAVADLDGDGLPDVVTAPGPGGAAHVRGFDPSGMELGREAIAFAGAFGTFVGGGRTDAALRRFAAGPENSTHEAFAFAPGDRAVFFGDSLTEEGYFTVALEAWLTLRYPEARFTFLNAGLGGDSAGLAVARFRAHVLEERPTKVVINFGLNDGVRGAFDPRSNRGFIARTRMMLHAARQAGVGAILLTPNAADARFDNPARPDVETQRRFYEPLRAVAAEFGVPFADQYSATRAAVERMAIDDPSALFVKPYWDGYHAIDAGGLLMAHAILTRLHAPAVTSSVALDAGGTLLGASGAVVDQVSAGGVLSFRRADDGLPLPVLDAWRSVLPYVNHLGDLGRYDLRVVGLTPGRYRVGCDGVTVAEYAADEMASGVNLALASAGPVFDQGAAVVRAIQVKNELTRRRFREVLLSPENPLAWPGDGQAVPPGLRVAEAARRLAEIEAWQAFVWELARPTPHVWTVERVA